MSGSGAEAGRGDPLAYGNQKLLTGQRPFLSLLWGKLIKKKDKQLDNTLSIPYGSITILVADQAREVGNAPCQ